MIFPLGCSAARETVCGLRSETRRVARPMTLQRSAAQSFYTPALGRRHASSSLQSNVSNVRGKGQLGTRLREEVTEVRRDLLIKCPSQVRQDGILGTAETGKDSIDCPTELKRLLFIKLLVVNVLRLGRLW